jgi:hypothetical protein
VAGVALPERHHGHELGDVLPDADHVGDADRLQIAPDRRGAERQPEMKRGGFIGGEPSRIGSSR